MLGRTDRNAFGHAGVVSTGDHDSTLSGTGLLPAVGCLRAARSRA